MKTNLPENTKLFRTFNRVEIRGHVVDIYQTDANLILVLYTKDRHNGQVFPSSHQITIRLDSPIYRNAKMSRRGDVIEIRGQIGKDRTIVPNYFENFSYYADDRINQIHKNNGASPYEL